jgi:hypothetical protein
MSPTPNKNISTNPAHRTISDLASSLRFLDVVDPMFFFCILKMTFFLALDNNPRITACFDKHCPLKKTHAWMMGWGDKG